MIIDKLILKIYHNPKKLKNPSPQWARSGVLGTFADDHYLKQWVRAFDIGNDKIINSPVTNGRNHGRLLPHQNYRSLDIQRSFKIGSGDHIHIDARRLRMAAHRPIPALPRIMRAEYLISPTVKY